MTDVVREHRADMKMGGAATLGKLRFRPARDLFQTPRLAKRSLATQFRVFDRRHTRRVNRPEVWTIAMKEHAWREERRRSAGLFEMSQLAFLLSVCHRLILGLAFIPVVTLFQAAAPFLLD